MAGAVPQCLPLVLKRTGERWQAVFLPIWDRAESCEVLFARNLSRFLQIYRYSQCALGARPRRTLLQTTAPRNTALESLQPTDTPNPYNNTFRL
jgi:hypothetical protein